MDHQDKEEGGDGAEPLSPSVLCTRQTAKVVMTDRPQRACVLALGRCSSALPTDLAAGGQAKDKQRPLSGRL